MKNVIEDSIKYIFIGFCVISIAFTAMLTFQLMNRLIPENPVMGVMSLIFFDFGALIWLATFLFYAQGQQRIVAFLLMVFDLLGVIIMVASELWLSQTFTSVPAGLGVVVIWTVVLAAVINAVGGMYAFHLLDPEISRLIDENTRMDKIEKLTEEKYQLKLDEISDRLSEDKAKIMYRKALAKMHYTLGDGVIEGHFEEDEEQDTTEEKTENDDKPKYTGKKRGRKPKIDTSMVFAEETVSDANPIQLNRE